MTNPEEYSNNQALPNGLKTYIALVSAAGAGLLFYLATQVDWSYSSLGELAVFVALIVVAGSFPLPIAPRVKADVNTAVFFAAALVLEPGIAALSGVAGVLIFTVLLRFWGQRLKLPAYKYPFNAGLVALLIGVTALVFDALGSEGTILHVAIIPAAAVYYLLNTSLVSGAVFLQLKLNPMRIWWMGTRENGLAELGQLAFGLLGTIAYEESPWAVVALFIPVAIIYMAFSRLAKANQQLEEALEKLEALQGRIVSTSKLASVGAISLDLAHQIKNPLAIMLGRLETLEERLEPTSPAPRHLEIAMGAGDRIHELIQTFSSIGQDKWVSLEIKELLDEALGMAGLRSTKLINMDRNYGEDRLVFKGNPILIREALSNIFANAIDAVDEEGKISIQASSAGGSVVVNIIDNGVGITEETKVRLFEPFHSTKPNGHGIGLFAAKHILEMHHGTVEISSVEGEGTSVRVSLPHLPPQELPEGEDIDSLTSARSR